MGYTCPFCTNRADARAGWKNLEAPLPWHWSPFLCPYGNFRFNHRKGKDKEFLKTSLKACDGHFHMQTHTRAVCTMSIASSHIIPIMDPQRRVLAGPQVPSGRTGGQSPRPPAACSALARKGGHCCSLTQWKVLIPGLGTPGWLPWIRFSIQRNEGNTQLTPPNSMDSITLEDWGLKGVGSQMFHQMWDRANSVKKQRKNPN